LGFMVYTQGSEQRVATLQARLLHLDDGRV